MMTAAWGPRQWRVNAAGALLAVLLLAPLAPLSAGASPAGIAQLIGEPRLSGSGLLTWWGFRVYEARLWVAASGLDPQRFQASPFALEMLYARAFDGRSIADSSAEEIEKLGMGSTAQRERWLEAMVRVFPNVARGDRLVGIHRPGRGVSFLHNDRVIGVIDDPDFGAAFFSIWLDPRTSAPGLRKAILAGADAGTRPEPAKDKP